MELKPLFIVVAVITISNKLICIYDAIKEKNKGKTLAETLFLLLMLLIVVLVFFFNSISS